jgi:hypothetical protein
VKAWNGDHGSAGRLWRVVHKARGGGGDHKRECALHEGARVLMIIPSAF